VRTRPLSEVPLRDLRPLLQEEAEHWGSELLWDYADVASAVASGLERRALIGTVFQEGARTVAYCYYMLDGGRAIVGSVYAAAGFRGRGLEEELLDSVLVDAQRHPGNERVECQTLFSTAAGADDRFTRAGFKSRARHYLLRSLSEPLEVPAHTLRLRPLRREDLPLAAAVIHKSHVGSLDAALNMTYATPALCRGFVETLVLRAGCGRFDPEASFVAEGPRGPVGVLLASYLSRENGHICQVSVAPDEQSRGIGTVLLASAMKAMRQQGLTTASLSVTLDNHHAYRLYQRLGFALRKEFAAHAWARPPGRIELPQ
jgi:ribosomal protein S18 acetylase RimI-like enzyme